MLMLLAFVLLTLTVGFAGSAATMPALPTWYADLRKPPWTPPNWVFGPVWTTLYVLMAVAAWRIWRLDPHHQGLVWWGIQLFFNWLWSILFFGWKRPDLALLDIALLWSSIAVTMRLFWSLDPTAGALLIPYLAWVSYASTLNAGVWYLNRPRQ